MTRATLVLAQALSLVLLASCQYTANFINPPDRLQDSTEVSTNNPIYAVGESLNITWTTNAPFVSLTIWQSNSNSPNADIGGLQYLPNSGLFAASYYTWQIGTNGANGEPLFDLTKGNIFVFDLYSQGATTYMATTIYFNVTNSTVDAHGHLIPTTSTTSATASLTSSTATGSTTATAPPSASTEASSGLSSSGKVGVGVGIGLGIPILAALCFAIYLLRKRHAHGAASAEAAPASQNAFEAHEAQKVYHDPHISGYSEYQTPVYEMPHTEPEPSELPGSHTGK